MSTEALVRVTPETHPTYVAWKFTFNGRHYGDWVPLTPREQEWGKYIAEIKADALHRALVEQEGKELPMEDLRILTSKVASWHDPERLSIQRYNQDFKISDLAEGETVSE